jgi:hypothetical protein
MNKYDFDYADMWRTGFMTGFCFGIAVSIGLVWAIR